jgi:hypothetical protein
MFWSGLLLLAAIQSQAWAQPSCLPLFTALQTVITVDPTANVEHTFRLKQLRQGQVQDSRVFVQFTPRMEGGVTHVLDAHAYFDPTFDGVSLPYNLYSVMVVEDGEVIAWWDFTSVCKSPGLSFFPGRRVQLPSLKLVGERLQLRETRQLCRRRVRADRFGIWIVVAVQLGIGDHPRRGEHP